ncbi:MAG: diaminopimelate epimerase [Methanobrevibacter sp.]|jgi:diaminopimelate epimerase|nr:diaminopimelate epimerase [Candidatus Methanovirga basalitermitum]
MDLKGLKFSKAHGLGNDYVIVDESKEIKIVEENKADFSIEVCRRGFSIGADGVIFVTKATTEKGDIRFRIFNGDGSEAEMCGNGIRCFSKFIYDRDIVKKDVINVETLDGIKVVNITSENGISTLFKVDMGLSTFNTREIPMINENNEFLEGKLIVDDEKISLSVISVGNPHAIIFVDNVDKIDLGRLGPAIENHELFPERINVHFVELISNKEIKILTWERGAGYTHACGTGATSSVLIGYKLSKLDNKVLVHLPGGELEVKVYEKEGSLGAFMKGDAQLVFDGKIIQ